MTERPKNEAELMAAHIEARERIMGPWRWSDLARALNDRATSSYYDTELSVTCWEFADGSSIEAKVTWNIKPDLTDLDDEVDDREDR